MQKHVKLLWTWVILSIISNVLGLINGIYEGAQGNGLVAASEFLSAAIMAFGIYCVHRRIKDIRLNQQAAGYKQGQWDSSPDV